ncbi:MAG: two-component regulator propeller domain-containing protein [Rhizomicrobium sp.]
MRNLRAPARIMACSIAVALGVILISPRAAAADANRTIRGYVHTAWTLADGAPPDVWALAQSPDGYLWLGTGAGLFRFDGIRFERVKPTAGDAFPSTDVTNLLATPTGDIWIGYQNGGVSLLRNGRLKNFFDGPLSQSPNDFALDADNVLWVATNAGLARFVNGRWQTVGADWSLPPGSVWTVSVARDGTLWTMTGPFSGATKGSRLLYLRRGSKDFEEERGTASVAWIGTTAVNGLRQAADGRLWISANNASLFAPLEPPSRDGRNDGGKALTGPILPQASKFILFDHEGNLWGRLSRGGIFRSSPQEQAAAVGRFDNRHIVDLFSSKDGLTSDIDRSFLEDKEGNIWVGTNLGLDRFRPANVVTAAGIPVTAPLGYRAAVDEAGTVYIAEDRTLYRIRSGKPAEIIYHSPSRIDFLHGVKDGSVLLGMRGSLEKLARSGITKIELPAAFRTFNADTWEIDRNGVPWVSAWDRGIYRLDGNKWRRFVVGPALSGAGPRIHKADNQGRMWLHYFRRPLILVDGANIRSFSEKDGPRIGDIETIYPRARDVLFAGDQGIARFDGHRFQTLRSARFPVLNRVAGIVQTERGETWLNTIAGLVRFSTKDMERAFDRPGYPLHYQLLDFRDGLPGLAQQDSYQQTALEGANGRLWFITNHGVAWVDPEHLVRNPLPPPVSIRSLTANGNEYPFSAALTLPMGVSNLRIDYDALSLSVPERVRFRYRLDGVDNGWVDPGDRRQAFYTKLGPGDYRFQVIAANNDGVWNTTGATLRFTIPPTFLQSRWFLLLCLLAAVAVLWLLYSLRVRQVSARIRDRLEERLSERERIARELHDTLLQGFQGLVLRFQSVADRMPAGEPTRQLMNDVLDRADTVIIEGRDRVRDLRSSAGHDDLSLVVATAIDNLMPDSSIAIRMISEGAPRPVHAVVQDEISRIVREAVFNVIRHAQAKNLEICIAYKRRELSVHVRDDGKGIDPDTLSRGGREGHYGLTGMRERAQSIRAEFVLSSGPGAGTEIELTIPAAAAYTDNWGPWHFWRRLATVEG